MNLIYKKSLDRTILREQGSFRIDKKFVEGCYDPNLGMYEIKRSEEMSNEDGIRVTYKMFSLPENENHKAIIAQLRNLNLNSVPSIQNFISSQEDNRPFHSNHFRLKDHITLENPNSCLTWVVFTSSKQLLSNHQ